MGQRRHRIPGPRRVRRAVRSAQRLVAASDPNPHYAAAYRDAETRYWEHIPGWIVDDFGDSGASASLDVGCAYGTLAVYTQLVTGCDAYAVDFVPHYMSDRLVRSQGLHYAIANIELDPIPWERQFDIIIMTEVIEHLNFQARPTLERLAATLTPGGRIYMSAPDAAEWGPNHERYHRYADLPEPSEGLRSTVVDDHIWHFTEEELRAVIDAAGLDVVRFAHSPGVEARHLNFTLAAE